MREHAMNDREGLTILLTFFGLISLLPLLWHLARPEAPVERSRVVERSPDGCRAEVWVRGQEGDHLLRLMNFRKHRPPTFHSVAIQRANLTSIRTPQTVWTAAGRCQVVRWHLLVHNQEIESLRRTIGR